MVIRYEALSGCVPSRAVQAARTGVMHQQQRLWQSEDGGRGRVLPCHPRSQVLPCRDSGHGACEGQMGYDGLRQRAGAGDGCEYVGTHEDCIGTIHPHIPSSNSRSASMHCMATTGEPCLSRMPFQLESKLLKGGLYRGLYWGLL